MTTQDSVSPVGPERGSGCLSSSLRTQMTPRTPLFQAKLQDSGDRNSPQRRAERRRAVRAALDTMPEMAGSARGLASDTLDEPSDSEWETHSEEFWSTGPLICERCLALPPPVYEIGLPPWREGLPKSHQYALLINDDGARLPCFSHEVRESVRWHHNHPGQRPRTRRYWCLA